MIELSRLKLYNNYFHVMVCLAVVLPLCWNEPINMIYKEMDFPIGHPMLATAIATSSFSQVVKALVKP